MSLNYPRTIDGLIDLSTSEIIIGNNIQGNLIPSSDNVYNIGSNSFRWKDIHLAGVGYLTILNNGTSLNVPTSGSNLISDTATQTIKNKYIDSSNSLTDATDTT